MLSSCRIKISINCRWFLNFLAQLQIRAPEYNFGEQHMKDLESIQDDPGGIVECKGLFCCRRCCVWVVFEMQWCMHGDWTFQDHSDCMIMSQLTASSQCILCEALFCWIRSKVVYSCKFRKYVVNLIRTPFTTGLSHQKKCNQILCLSHHYCSPRFRFFKHVSHTFIAFSDLCTFGAPTAICMKHESLGFDSRGHSCISECNGFLSCRDTLSAPCIKCDVACMKIEFCKIAMIAFKRRREHFWVSRIVVLQKTSSVENVFF